MAVSRTDQHGRAVVRVRVKSALVEMASLVRQRTRVGEVEVMGVAQGSQYNSTLMQEHKVDAKCNTNTCFQACSHPAHPLPLLSLPYCQHITYPATRRAPILDYRPPTSKPFSLMSEQHHAGYRILRGKELERYPELYRQPVVSLTTGTRSILEKHGAVRTCSACMLFAHVAHA